jgi:hypothetical protein
MLRFGVVTRMTTPKLAPVWGHFFLASLAGLSLRIGLFCVRGLIAPGVKYVCYSVSAQNAEQPREHDNRT